MVQSVPVNTYNALQNAHQGLIPVYLFWIKAKNRQTGEVEEIGISTSGFTRTIQVIRPSDGAAVWRTYHAGVGLIEIPSIPSTMALQDTEIRVRFGNLAPEIVNAVKVFNPRGQGFQVHRLLLDRETRKPVDPALCLWDGIIKGTPIERDKVGGKGFVEIVSSGHTATLTRTNAIKMSDAFFEGRGDQAGRYVATIWRVRIPWGQSSIRHGKGGNKPKERFWR